MLRGGSLINVPFSSASDPLKKSARPFEPSADGGKSGEYGLAWEKLFLEGDERWRPLLVAAPKDMSTLK